MPRTSNGDHVNSLFLITNGLLQLSHFGKFVRFQLSDAAFPVGGLGRGLAVRHALSLMCLLIVPVECDCI